MAAAFSYTMVAFPAYTGNLSTLQDQLSRALNAIENNAGHAGANNDLALKQQVITKFFYDNREKLSAITVFRNGTFFAYIDASGLNTVGAAQPKGMIKAGDADTTLDLTSADHVMYDVALTAARNVALPTTMSTQHTFTVTRSANATGASALTVKQASTTLWTGAAAKAWAKFASDGTNWFLVAQGTLP